MNEERVRSLLETITSCSEDWNLLDQNLHEIVEAVHWALKEEYWPLVQQYVALLESFFLHYRPVVAGGEEAAAIGSVAHHWRVGYQVLDYGLVASKQLDDAAAVAGFLGSHITLAVRLGTLAATLTVLGRTNLINAQPADYFDLLPQQVAQYLSVASGLDLGWDPGYVVYRWARQIMDCGYYATAHKLLAMALALVEKEGYKPGIADLHLMLGRNAELWGRLAEAVSYYSETIGLCRDAGYELSIANALLGLARIAYQQGDIDAAQQFASDGLAVAGEHITPVGTELRALLDEIQGKQISPRDDDDNVAPACSQGDRA